MFLAFKTAKIIQKNLRLCHRDPCFAFFPLDELHYAASSSFSYVLPLFLYLKLELGGIPRRWGDF